jgi:hypothetical protein
VRDELLGRIVDTNIPVAVVGTIYMLTPCARAAAALRKWAASDILRFAE